MYEQHFGFREKPFSLTPDPAFLFLGAKHMTGISLLRYGLMNRAGITVLTGDIGAGKTTLLRQLLNETGDDIVVGLISNTHESFGNLMQWVAVAFGLPVATDSKALLYEQFAQFLIDQYAEGKRTVLVVDEAQNLENRSLEELRLLTNINADKDQLLQLVLAGQPELREKLQQPGLVQFVQRIAVDYHLRPLGPDETAQYIDHRLITAGGAAGLFEPVACRFIHYQSGGVPRLVNAICDTALVYAYAAGEQRVSVQVVFDMVIERVAAGLFGAGVLDFTGLAADSPAALRKKGLERARRRAGLFFRRAHADLGLGKINQAEDPGARA